MAIRYSIEKTANPENTAFSIGVAPKKVYGSVAKTADVPADNDYVILAENIPVSACVHKLNLTHGNITSMNDTDILVLDKDGNVVKNSDSETIYLAETVSFANARANVDVLAAKQKSIKELAGKGGDKLGSYVDIAMQVVTGGSDTGTVKWDVEFSTPA